MVKIDATAVIAIISVIIAVYALLSNIKQHKISNIEKLVKDICIGLHTVRIENVDYEYRKICDEILITFNGDRFYDPVRRQLGAMYELYCQDEKGIAAIISRTRLNKNKEHIFRLYIYCLRQEAFGIPWMFIFEKFRDYEYLMGMTKSALGDVELSFFHNTDRRLNFEEPTDREQRKYAMIKKFLNEVFTKNTNENGPSVTGTTYGVGFRAENTPYSITTIAVGNSDDNIKPPIVSPIVGSTALTVLPPDFMKNIRKYRPKQKDNGNSTVDPLSPDNP